MNQFLHKLQRNERGLSIQDAIDIAQTDADDTDSIVIIRKMKGGDVETVFSLDRYTLEALGMIDIAKVDLIQNLPF